MTSPATVAATYDRCAPLVWASVGRVLTNETDRERVAMLVLVEICRPVEDGGLGGHLTDSDVMSHAHRSASERARQVRGTTGPGGRSVDVGRSTSLDGHEPCRRLGTTRMIERTSVHLAYCEGRSVGEIAEALDVPTDVALVALRGGLGRLRALRAGSSAGSRGRGQSPDGAAGAT